MLPEQSGTKEKREWQQFKDPNFEKNSAQISPFLTLN
jgi:hypothetical protein